MGYKIFQKTVLKIKLTAEYLGKIIGFTIIFQVFIFSLLFSKAVKDDGFDAKVYAKSFIKKEFKNERAHHEVLLLQNYQLPLFYSFASWLLPFLIISIFARKEKSKNANQRRGAKLISVEELVKSLRIYQNKYLKIGGFDKKKHFLTEEDSIYLSRNREQELKYRKSSIEIPEKFESLHFCIIGRSGTGKTSLINPLVTQIRARGDRMIIHDYKQDFVNNFYDQDTDLIFNPANPEISLKWNLFNDISNHADIVAVANSLIPASSEKEDPFWKNSARDIFTACLIYLLDAKKTTNKDLYELVNSSNEQIQEQLLSCPDTLKFSHVFERGNAKTLNSIMSVFRTNMRCLDYLKDIDGKFSIKKWAKNGTETIFVTNDESVKDAIAPALTLFIDLTSRALLMQEDREDRTIFMLDEFGRLNKMSSVVDLLTNGRSKGVSVYVVAQELAQIDEKYGKNGRKTIINNCSNQVFFSANDAESAKEFAAQIGEEESQAQDESIHHKTESDDMDGLNIRKHLQTKSIVLASEIQNLKEREFFIKVAGQNWSKNKVYITKKRVENE